jgi:hypothetical protein
MSDFYARMVARREDDSDLVQCVERVVNQLNDVSTSISAPGMLLGKIQSGKTRGFLGVIAKAFDRDFDIAVVLTKGTKTLVSQTVKRISSEKEFKQFIDDEDVILFDIMEAPQTMTKSELRRKMIIVAKKQNKNLERLLHLFSKQYPELQKKRLLLVDDEADMASVRFVKNKKKDGQKRDDRAGDLVQGTIAQQMDDLRALVGATAYLQVTATPYALYLQPEEYVPADSGFVFYPKRPAFTELLPVHGGYVGGDDYFGNFGVDDPRHYLFVEVPEDEQNALRGHDERAIRVDRVWTSKNIEVLRKALMTFLTAVAIRRWQQADQGEVRKRKYAMIVHNDTQRLAHDWQWRNLERLREAFEEAAATNDRKLRTLFDSAFTDLSRSVHANKGRLPTEDEAFLAVKELILDGEINTQLVNSDQKLAPLLDPETAELKLRTPANIFIGGSILDRGITVPNLISFYYGRNPKRMQADTVLQHSRMYGARDRQDLAVTRFYTSELVRDRLEKIHHLETILREAFERGDNENGVVFIQKDANGHIVPCAPSKTLASDIVTVRPNDLYLPSDFDTLVTSSARTALAELTTKLSDLDIADTKKIEFITPNEALALIRLARRTLTKSGDPDFSWEAMEGLTNYFAMRTGRVGIIVETGRRIDRQKSGDKSGLSILGGNEMRALIRGSLRDDPTLIFLQQQGGTKLHWASDGPFWWPLLAAPTSGEPCIFSVDP